MSALADDWRYAPTKRQEVVTIPVIWLAFALSVIFHIAMMWTWLPRLHSLTLTDPDADKTPAALVARLLFPSPPAATETPSPPPAPSAELRAPPMRRAAPARTPPRTPKPAPSPPDTTQVPVITAPASPAPVTAPAPAPPPTLASAAPPAAKIAPPEGDLSSYIEARRRARGESTIASMAGVAPNAPPAEDENTRRDRIVAENLASINKQTFGYDPRTSGGVFVLKRVGYDEAEFIFNGWNKDIGRQTRQLIEVRKGGNADIQTAIIRKIISIIREHEPNEFTWRSTRLQRDIVLSSRPADNAGLEDFMMREFFNDARQPY